ncbi:MAG: DUF6102 family protein [Oscillospiraceae bacterium]
MSGIITDFIYEIINESIMTFFNGFFTNIITMAFFAEQYISSVLSNSTFNEIYSFIYTVSISLIIIKFLKKGFFVYILWRDGDADTSPVETLVSLGLATFIMAAFPTLYQSAVDISLWFIGEIGLQLGGFATVPDNELLAGVFLGTKSLVNAIQMLIYLVMLVLMYFKYLRLGIELMILRLGVPFACSGLVDSDSGVFKPYMEQIVKTIFTIIIQYFCLMLSLALMIRQANGESLWWAIALCAVALSTPRLLSSFLIGANGGGKFTSAVHTSSALMNLIKK